MKIPFYSLISVHQQLRSEMVSVFEEVYDSGWYLLGEKLSTFEKEYAGFNEVNFSIGTGSGLDALKIALKALGIGKGDEVIVPSHTFIASAQAVSLTGAKPVFVEPRLETFNLNPDLIEPAITSSTKAIMPVHLYGQPCEMENIMKIADKSQLFVIEDNAQAHGAIYNGKMTGSFGQINATSFYPVKNLGALGDAGLITTHTTELYEKSRLFRNYGSTQKYVHQLIGENSRIDEMQAAFLSVKLKYLKSWNLERRRLAELYLDNLKQIDEIHLPFPSENSFHVYHLFVIRTQKRDQLQAYLSANGIETIIHYPIPTPMQPAYQPLGFRPGNFPIAEEISRTCLSLPLFIGLKDEEIVYICEKIKMFFS